MRDQVDDAVGLNFNKSAAHWVIILKIMKIDKACPEHGSKVVLIRLLTYVGMQHVPKVVLIRLPVHAWVILKQP